MVLVVVLPQLHSVPKVSQQVFGSTVVDVVVVLSKKHGKCRGGNPGDGATPPTTSPPGKHAVNVHVLGSGQKLGRAHPHGAEVVVVVVVVVVDVVVPTFINRSRSTGALGHVSHEGPASHSEV